MGDVLHHEHRQSVLGRRADTEVHLLLHDEILLRLVHVGVEVRVLAEGRHERLGDERQVAELGVAAGAEALVEPGAERGERLRVAFLHEGEVRRGELAADHRFGDPLAQATDGDPLLAARHRRGPRQRRAGLRGGRGRYRGLLLLLDIGEDVALHHPSERTGPLQGREIHSHLARHAPGDRSSEDPVLAVSATHDRAAAVLDLYLARRRSLGLRGAIASGPGCGESGAGSPAACAGIEGASCPVGGRGAACVSVPPSASRTTSVEWTLAISPSLPTVSSTLPRRGLGITTVALSVITSRSGWSSTVWAPALTSHLTISPSTTPSPMSGSLNSQRAMMSSGRLAPSTSRAFCDAMAGAREAREAPSGCGEGAGDSRSRGSRGRAYHIPRCEGWGHRDGRSNAPARAPRSRRRIRRIWEPRARWRSGRSCGRCG